MKPIAPKPIYDVIIEYRSDDKRIITLHLADHAVCGFLSPVVMNSELSFWRVSTNEALKIDLFLSKNYSVESIEAFLIATLKYLNFNYIFAQP